nr:MAG TPA: hypothetical protein [Caudoviricetes sp.]
MRTLVERPNCYAADRLRETGHNTKLFYNKEVYGLNIPQNAGNIGTAVIWRNASPTDNYGTIIGDYNNQINTELKLLNGEVWLIRTNADETKTEKLIAKL